MPSILFINDNVTIGFINKCSFLDKEGLCVLQKLAIQEGKHAWEYKPMYCVLFPLTIYEGALTIDDEHIDRLKTCNVETSNKKSIHNKGVN